MRYYITYTQLIYNTLYDTQFIYNTLYDTQFIYNT